MWSAEFEAHIIVEGGTGENPLTPTLELTNWWVKRTRGNVSNMLIRNRIIAQTSPANRIMHRNDNAEALYRAGIQYNG